VTDLLAFDPYQLQDASEITTPEEMWECVKREMEGRNLTSLGRFNILKGAHRSLMAHVRRAELARLRECEAALLETLKSAKSTSSHEYAWPTAQIQNIHSYRELMEQIDHVYVCSVLSPMLEKHLDGNGGSFEVPTKAEGAAPWPCANHLEPQMNDAASSACEVCGRPKP
jgi:hypothetical protein